MNQRELFLTHVAQTSPAPLALDITHAAGTRLTDAAGKEYIDLIGGISVANTGHRHPHVVQAIQAQAGAYLHVMVYGEFIQSPQVQYAQLLTAHLPASLNCVYFTNSGAEAVEGAMKLAKRVTRRSHIIACNQSYHGSTQGALSIIGDEYWRNAYRPLLPGIYHLPYNDEKLIAAINEHTACVIIETVQAEAGIIAPGKDWMQALRKKCTQTGTLLILDEIQAGFGRTGTLWAFEQYGILPDVLLLGKALGGGMPLGAFIADKKLMLQLADNPVLGHITTFGGHPVCCAAGKAAMEVLLAENILPAVKEKENILIKKLQHRKIKSLHTCGLWAAVGFESFEQNKKIIDAVIAARPVGVLTDWFLFAADKLRISPPLTITTAELEMACDILLTAMDAA